ncbi:hypothetical protein [Nocardioides stalactiti]|uniref:hypothetical protein n=1 Tax=Nocardioides stalactiti TaxID=2755356 RepID=UPI001602822A|nr:hypothetical protein [Nocardioides stalactiti]
MTRVLALVLLSFLLAACGDDGGDQGDGGADKDDDASAESTLTPDQTAVQDALVASFFDPSCALLTDDYLLEKAFAADTVEEACEEHMSFWSQPQYDEDDVLVSDIVVEGDVATAVVGSAYVNIETTYELQRVDGAWLVSCEDFSCDRLDAPDDDTPSAEVS